MPTGSEQGGDAQTLAAALPPLRLPPPDAPLLPAVTAGSRSPHLDSAWSEAFGEASLLSPMASGAVGRSFSCKASPEWRVQLLRGAEAESGGGWGAVAREARSLSCLALPISVTNFAGFAIGLVTIRCVGCLLRALMLRAWLPACRRRAAAPARAARPLPAAAWWGAWAPLS